jgi:hypothetical protein
MDPCKMQEARQNARVNIAPRHSDRAIDLATITAFFVDGMPVGMCRTFRRFLF